MRIKRDYRLCSKYQPEDIVQCRICNKDHIVSEMPKTKTGFRFVCKKCLHAGSLEKYHKRKSDECISFDEVVSAIKSVTARPVVMGSTNNDRFLAGADGSILVLPTERCLGLRDSERITMGHVSKRGYNVITEGGKSVYVHRLVCEAFLYPSELPVNHINGVPTDNRLCNLEYVSEKQNQHHKSLFLLSKKKAYRHNTLSGRIWYSRIEKDGVGHYLGSFTTEEEASNAYDIKEKELYGEYFEKYKELAI